MRIQYPGYSLLWFDGHEMLSRIEIAGRTCYRSEDHITQDSAQAFVKTLIDRGHESVLEHEKITAKFICDRGVSHELVRHRIASFSQESTRYCNYSKTKFGHEITVIRPPFWEEGSAEFALWRIAGERAEHAYFDLLKCGASPQEARSVLPTCLKTEIVVTANLREWRLILKQRTAKAAHPQMRQLMVKLLAELRQRIPVVFDDIGDVTC